MGIRAIKAGKTYEYVSRKDDGYSEDGNHKPEATKWKLKVLTGQEMAEIRDRQANISIDTVDGKMSAPGIRMSMFATAYHTLALGLVGWSNFLDEEGNAVPFTKGDDGRPSKESLDMIPPDVAFDISRELIKANAVDDTVVGNSKAS